ncbi:MAG: hypothetical protein KGI51_00880 [Rhodospirillales bacterium]|nr:hypothetical protein [Rhodospirillales bacterium]
MMTRIVKPLVVAAALLLSGAGNFARADVLFNNTGLIPKGSISVSSALYQSFSTGSFGVDLTSLSLSMVASQPTDGASFKVSLYGDSGNHPSGPMGRLAVVADSSLSTTASILQIASFAPKALAANTRYWIQLSSFGTPATSAAWSFVNSSRGANVSSQFSLNTAGVVGVTPDSASGVSVFVMQAIGVPEPGSFWLLSIAALLLSSVASRRSIRRSKRACS